jgi:predicted nucleotidyltransferase
MSPLENAILQTLTYSDHFGFPLTLEELYVRLIQSSCTKSELNKILATLVNRKKIGKKGEYYHLSGRSNLIAKRAKNAQISLPAQQRAKELADKLGKVPGVLAIYLTGSLAMANSIADSDIDFMVITNNNQLWTTRFLLTIFTSLIGLRRSPGSKQNTGKLCLNLYLTPKSFLLPTVKRSLYTAYELMQAVPLYDPHNTHANLLSTNSWIHGYLPNFPLPKGRLLDRKHGQRPSWDTEGGRSLPVGILEFFSYSLQLLYMKNKITREYVTRDAAFFHPRDPSSKILKKLSLE